MFWAPSGNETVVIESAGLMTMLSALVAVTNAESLAATVKSAGPEAVGVPSITPVPLSRFSPAGRDPAVTLQVTGGVPPLAARVAPA